MKQLIIGVILAVCLVGCGEKQKPQFTISEYDTLETYADNPVFTKVETHFYPATEDDKKAIAYQFIGGPESFYGIQTDDLNALGGGIYFLTNPNIIRVSVTIKGKESFDKLANRLTKSKDFACKKIEIGTDRVFQCTNKKIPNSSISVYYNSLSDILSLSQFQQVF